jgi:hypothetical protein
MDAIDLLPIHYFIDPGPDFAWPIDEELSDEKIHLYTHYGESRMETLETYLNLSKEFCLLPTLLSPSTTNSNIHDDAPSSTDTNPMSTVNLDISSSTNETISTTTPVINKKLSRPSFNSFSKIIRRTFIDPFSSAKRASLKQQRQQQQTDVSDTSNETEHVRRASSPLLNRRTNMLTIIVTNFQPKRPKTSDNMIKNYIDACMNEYRLEKNRKQMNETSITENENSDWNHHDSSSYQQPQQSTLYNRHQTSSSLNNTNRYPQTNSVNEPSIGRKLPSIPSNSSAAVKHVQKNNELDDNEDLLPMENGQFSSNINYIQQTQRKSNHLTQVRS